MEGMELQGQDLTNLPLALSLPRAKLPIFTYPAQVPQQQQQRQDTLIPSQLNAAGHYYQGQGYFPQMQSQQQQQHLVEPYQQTEQTQQPEQVLRHDDSGFDLMDDSLTDMQWLQRMDAVGVPEVSKDARKRAQARGAVEKENKKPGKEGGSCRKKLDYSSSKKSSNSNKPPLSYASLISLAICSTPQRMMTLSGIYRWIETTFPFYRTPEAKAWKNSIRHNLSIRKNMFMKVYQYPPRRGNGSYWTLLSDGEEELKRAVPLFSTFRPPVIDPECIYYRSESTHTVKSKGQFVPLLPRNTLSSSGQGYFSVDGTMSSSAQVQTDEEITTEVVIDSVHLESESVCNARETKSTTENLPAHILEHSYAKYSHIPVEELLDSSTDSDNENKVCPPTPKRRKTSRKTSFRRSACVDGTSRARVNDQEGYDSDSKDDEDDVVFQTPPNEADSSLNLLDSSLLTPLRDPDIVEIGPISLSPLYTNFVTPKSSRKTERSLPSNTESTRRAAADTPTLLSSSSTSLYSNSSNSLQSTAPPLPLTPLRCFSSSNSILGGVGSFDSGIFSPLSTDTFNAFKFSTPNLSPLTDLLQPNTFSTPHAREFLSPLKVLDSSDGHGNTPIRLGSLEALGLPGFTPPASSLKRSFHLKN